MSHSAPSIADPRADCAQPRSMHPDATIAFSSEELNVMHRWAHAFYTQGAYQDAARYYWFLAQLAPRETTYLKGLGASQFMARRFDEAADTYSLLTLLARRDAEAHCLCGHSLLMLGEHTDARNFLEHACRLPGKPEFSAKARALLALIEA
jgi:Flp pilus assembly protein TadD